MSRKEEEIESLGGITEDTMVSRYVSGGVERQYVWWGGGERKREGMLKVGPKR